MEDFYRKIGLVAGAIMPLFNVPLIIRIMRRRSSADISLIWLLGVWGCIVLMYPSTVVSADPVLRVFGLSNLLFFSAVVGVVLYYRWRPAEPPGGNKVL